MCKITFNEFARVDGIDHAAFESWFKSNFGVKSVSALDVLNYYINVLERDSRIERELIDLIDGEVLVFDPMLDQAGQITVDGKLFVPAGTIVKSAVNAKGIYSTGDVLFKAAVLNSVNDIRLGGRLIALSLESRKAGAIADAVDVTGDILCEGDLIANHHIHCQGRLSVTDHLRAQTLLVGESASIEGGTHVFNGVAINRYFHHQGALEIPESLVVGA